MPRKRMTTKAVQAEAERPFEGLPSVAHKPEIDADAWGKDGLTFKQRLFVRYYVGVAGGNGTKAAELAGYNANNREALAVTASETLRKPNVQRALARAMAKHQGTKAKTLAGIAELASVNIENYLLPDGTFDLERARAGGAMGAIREMEIEEIGPGVRRVKVKTYDRLKALALLAKIHGTLIDRVEHTGANGGPIEMKRSDYDAIEAELGDLAGSRLASRITSNN